MQEIERERKLDAWRRRQRQTALPYCPSATSRRTIDEYVRTCTCTCTCIDVRAEQHTSASKAASAAPHHHLINSHRYYSSAEPSGHGASPRPSSSPQRHNILALQYASFPPTLPRVLPSRPMAREPESQMLSNHPKHSVCVNRSTQHGTLMVIDASARL